MSGKVTLFEDKNFGGAKHTIDLRSKVEGRLYSLKRSVLHDKMSSVKWTLPEGAHIKLYEHADGTGRSYSRSGQGSDSDTHNNDFKDCASSYRWFWEPDKPASQYCAKISSDLIIQMLNDQIFEQIASHPVYFADTTRIVRISAHLFTVIISLKASVPVVFDPSITIRLDVRLRVEHQQDHQRVVAEVVGARSNVGSSLWKKIFTFGFQKWVDSEVKRLIQAGFDKFSDMKEEIVLARRFSINLLDVQLDNAGNLLIFVENAQQEALVNVYGSQMLQNNINGSIWLYEDNFCKGSMVGAFTDKRGQFLKLTETPGFSSDEARSATLVNLRRGTKIMFFDSATGSRQDDYLVIEVLQQKEKICISSFQRENFAGDNFIRYTYHKRDGLDGKVSRITVS